MPRKQPVKTLKQWNDLNSKHYGKRAKAVQKGLESAFTLELADRAMRRHLWRLNRGSFGSLPDYHELVLAAARRSSPLRRKLSQGANARKPRRNFALNIGPLTPPVPGPSKRLPRTVDSLIIEFVRTQPASCKTLWRRLPAYLAQYNLVVTSSISNTRQNTCHIFILEGKRSPVSFGQFEKLFTQARRH